MKVKFKSIVRKQPTYNIVLGKITSKYLSKFIGKKVLVIVRDIDEKSK